MPNFVTVKFTTLNICRCLDTVMEDEEKPKHLKYSNYKNLCTELISILGGQ